jgi:purine-cytosine permease-like protein
MAWGTNAIYSILVAALVIFLTGIPLAITAARYNIDLDLITRSAGFGYFGSVITSIIFAGFTFIFFALEGSIMAQGLLVGLGIPLWMGYLIATLMVLPLVVYGMKALTRLQVDHAAVAGADGGAGGVADCQRSAAGGRLPAFRR